MNTRIFGYLAVAAAFVCAIGVGMRSCNDDIEHMEGGPTHVPVPQSTGGSHGTDVPPKIEDKPLPPVSATKQ